LQVFRLGISGPNLDSLIDRYRGEIRQHLSIDASLTAQKLFQVLVQPAAGGLYKDAHVIIVADSKLYSVNFEALVSSQGGLHYWVDDVALENASSLDLWMAGGKRRQAPQGLLLMGASIQADPRFPLLPNATKEMDNVGKYFREKEVTRFSGSDATPHAYLSSAPGNFKYVYFATHGISNPVNPMESAIILSPDPDGTYKLLARDIVNSKLKLNADLVTISACEGAGTNLQSLEGLLGLEWAFLRAGAHRVVAGLWDVDDASTPAFMNDFYRELSQGRDAVDALKDAKRAMLHSKDGIHNHPYYWASLQLYTGS
jgi:CHAT domain-containing protein